MKVDLELIYLSLGLVFVAGLRAKLSSLCEEILEEYGDRRLFLLKNKLIYDLLNHLEADCASSTSA